MRRLEDLCDELDSPEREEFIEILRDEKEGLEVSVAQLERDLELQREQHQVTLEGLTKELHEKNEKINQINKASQFQQGLKLALIKKLTLTLE